MTASVVPFPAVNKSRKAHARFRDGWLSRLASDPAFQLAIWPRLDPCAAHERKDAPGMAIHRQDCAADWSQPQHRLALHWAPEEGWPDHGYPGRGRYAPQSVLLR